MRLFIFICTTSLIAYLAYLQIPQISMTQKLESPSHLNISPPFSLVLPKPSVNNTHSSSIAPLYQKDDGARLLVAYFGGSREGARDVEIYANMIDIDAKGNLLTSPAFSILSRARLSHDSKELIKKLGNPLLIKQANSLHLFVTATSFGGWANSKLYHYEVISEQGDITLRFKNKLHTSPFISLSTLVRTPGVSLQDGSYLLPAYHELARKYPILILLKKDKIAYIMRPTLKNTLLQPTITTPPPFTDRLLSTSLSLLWE